jgi:hypothetical protein
VSPELLTLKANMCCPVKRCPQHRRSRRAATDERGRAAALMLVETGPRPTRPVPHVSGPDLQQRAWQWAMAHRDADGSLPSGKQIASHLGRHERWGRLVKRAGMAVPRLGRRWWEPSRARSGLAGGSCARTFRGGLGSGLQPTVLPTTLFPAADRSPHGTRRPDGGADAPPGRWLLQVLLKAHARAAIDQHETWSVLHAMLPCRSWRQVAGMY